MLKIFYKILFLSLLPIGALCQNVKGNSWQEVLEKKSGTIIVTWYTSTPFIYRNEKNNLTGIEYEILTGFQQYLKQTHGVSLSIQWWENESFIGTYETIKDSRQTGLMGISAFSITPKRQIEVAFAPPYMSDISVMISSYNVPIVKNTSEFKTVFNNLKAITIEGTTYAEDLEELKKQHQLNFEIEYIPSSENIQRTISKTDSAFGFIDLPIYLKEFSRNSSMRIKRQNLFPIKRVGYSIILPLESDWVNPLEEYLLSQSFQREKDAIIGKYIDWEVYDFIKSLYTSGNHDIFLLTKEKEIQNEALLGKTEQIKRETIVRNFLISGVIIILISLFVITRFYLINRRTTLLLHEQKEKIESQHRDIEVQKRELEQHNKRLVELDEEKNYLIHILAHDLRSPINQMAGLTRLLLMEKDHLSTAQHDVIENMQSASTRMVNMITRILDVDSLDKPVQDLPSESISLDPFLRDVVERFTPAANQKEITLAFTPNGSPSIQADAVHLTQVVENILSNALKFSDRGKKVHMQLQETDKSVELHIRDEGPGFTEEDKKNMFRKFQRLSAKPTGSESSTGLGLSIVKKYADLMKAQVSVISQPGEGCTFVVSFLKR